MSKAYPNNRREIYRWLESNGFELTEKRQKELSHLLRENANLRTAGLQERLRNLSNTPKKSTNPT